MRILAWEAYSKGTVGWFLNGSKQLRGESIHAGRNCQRPTIWPDSSEVRVLLQEVVGFESRSGHDVFFPPL